MTGHMKGGLPFELPVLDETFIVETSSQRVEETEIVISHEDLRQMEDVYKKELPELKSVLRLYKMEEEKAQRATVKEISKVAFAVETRGWPDGATM